MNNFEKLKSMSVDELSEWLDNNGMWDNSLWSKWFDEEYCKKCEDIMCKSPDDSREFRCAYCEIYDNCRFFPEKADVPDSKEIIRMWLEAGCEEIAHAVDDELCVSVNRINVVDGEQIVTSTDGTDQAKNLEVWKALGLQEEDFYK